MRVTGNFGSRTWQINKVEEVVGVLSWRDSLGGGIFFLTPDDADYPYLCLRISGDVGDIQFYPEEGHCGLRCLGGEGLPKGGLTTLRYEGCDPASGEETANELIVPLTIACRAAAEFLTTGRRPECVSWFDLEEPWTS